MNERGDLGRPRYAYVPFAGGPHQCIGNEFAMIEGLVALTMIVRRFEFTRVDDGPVPMTATRTAHRPSVAPS